MRKPGILIIFLLFFAHQSLFAQCCDNMNYKPDPKVRKQFDYFGFSISPDALKLENALLPDGHMTMYMEYWSDLKKSNSDRVFEAVKKGVALLKDSLDDPLNQYKLTLALTPGALEPLYRFEKNEPKTTDFVEINGEVASVKYCMDSVIVVDYFYNMPRAKDSTLRSVVYAFSVKELAALNLDNDWVQQYDSLNIFRKKGIGWKNFRSRMMLIGGAGISVAMNGTAYPAMDFSLCYNMNSGPLPGSAACIGYGGSIGYAGFNGKRGLYLFHGLDIGALSGSGFEQMTVQKIGLRIGAAHIKPFEDKDSPRDYHSAAYLGVTFPLGKIVNFRFDFASNFRFTEGNHVGYFGGSMKFYFRAL